MPPSPCEGPVNPPASSRRPLDGPPGGSGKQQKTAFDFMSRSTGLTCAQLTCKGSKPEPTPEGTALSGTRMFEMGDANAAEEIVWCGRWAKGAEAVTVKITLQGNKIRFRESDPCTAVAASCNASQTLAGGFDRC